MSDELNLLTEGASYREVCLPDNTKLRILNKTKLPIKQLLVTAREADVLPRLKRSLLIVNKMSEEGYNTYCTQATKEWLSKKKEPPPSQPMSRQYSTEQLWTVSVTTNKTGKRKEANNVYSLPSIPPPKCLILSCSSHISSQRNMDGFNPSWKLCHMARTDSSNGQKALSQSDKTQKGHMKNSTREIDQQE
jgi:hypothetical protein